jgi:hypothetical protein
MRVFLDFEASSLGKNGYPIEVGWVFEDGACEAHLIRPGPQWTDWDDDAEAVHGISRAKLEEEGTAHEDVARRMVDLLSGHALYASAPSWDGKWMSVLLRAAGLPRHSLRLRDTEEVQLEGAIELLQGAVPPADVEVVARGIVERIRAASRQAPVSHRAFADAEAERQIWLRVRTAAEEEVRTRQG